MTPIGHLPRNPYIAGDPVGKTPAFVGREDVLREVLRVLRHPRENAITLYGQRRIGKTSVLQWLEAHLPKHGPYRPVYFDLMGYAGRPLGEILTALAAAIARHLGLSRPTLAEPPEQGFRAWLDQVLAQTLPADQALVLLMDEFDVQADPQADKDAKQRFFTYMRDLRRLAPQRLQFVFVLGRTIDDLDIVAQGLFKDLPSKRVSLFTREEAERVVRLSEREGSLTWTDAAVARVWDWAGGHPYLTQALCREVWERAYEAADEEGLETPPPVTPQEVDAAVPATLERSENVFAWIWDGLGPAERIVAAALAAAGPGVVDEETLTRILNEAGVGIVIRELRDAPKLLQDWDILAPADGGYRFRVELLRRWIAERKPLRRVQDELDRLVPLAESLYRAALGFFQNGQLDQARNLLRQARRVNPHHLSAHELLAEVYLAQGNLDAARRTLENLHELAPGRARARLKQVYLRRAEAEDDPAARRRWYEKVLALNPDDPQAREGLFASWQEQGEQALDAGDLEAALQAFQRALEVQEDPALREKVADIERALREQAIEEALAEIRTLEARKDYAAAYDKLQALAEKYPQAREWKPELERLAQLRDLEILYRRALAQLKAGDRETAKRLLAQVVGLDPDYEEAARYLYLAVHGEDPAQMSTAKDKQQAASDTARTKASREPQQQQQQQQQREKGLHQKSPPPRLSPWNPLDYLRLLWWVLVTPEQLQRYRKRYGEKAERSVGNRLAYTMALWPLLLLLWGLALGLLPRNAEAGASETYGWLGVDVGLLWLLLMIVADKLEGLEGLEDLASLVAGVIGVGVALGVAGLVAGGVAGLVAGVVAVGVALGVAGDVAGDVASDVVGIVVGVVAVGVALGVAVLVVGGVAGLVAGGVAFGVSYVVAFGVADAITDNVKSNKPTRWALALLAFSWAELLFFSLGGLTWLQTGRWPTPTWPF